jgi:hypothetical protein
MPLLEAFIIALVSMEVRDSMRYNACAMCVVANAAA